MIVPFAGIITLPFGFLLAYGQMDAMELGKHVVPPHSWPARTLARCGRPFLDSPSLCSRLLHLTYTALLSLLPTGLLDLHTDVAPLGLDVHLGVLACTT